MGSAGVRGRLWGGAPRDWVEVGEPLTRPPHEATSAALAPLFGLTVPDAGRGTGPAMRLAFGAGVRVTGLDAAPPASEFWHGTGWLRHHGGGRQVHACRPPLRFQLVGMSTVSMRYTVAFRVCTLPHTTRASLAV